MSKDYKCSVPARFSKDWVEELVVGLTARFTTIQESIADLKTSITEVKSDVKSINDKLMTKMSEISEFAKEAVKSAKENSVAIRELRTEMSQMKHKFRAIENENEALKNQCNQNELYSRRDNLIFHGIKEENDESNLQCDLAMRKFLCEKLELSGNEVNAMKFVRCHRLRGSKYDAVRPIIVRFREYSDREEIWRNLSKLRKTSQYYISEDFPPQMVYNRRKLMPIFAKARQSPGLGKNKVALRGDTLIIDNVRYNVKTLENLRGDLHPTNFSRRSNESVEVFGGIYSDHNALSNYGKYPVHHGDHVFPTLEHGYVYQKCIEAGEETVANSVFGVTEAHQAKRIGENLKNINMAEWSRKKDDIMMDLLKSKFTPNSEPARALLATGNRILGEAGLDTAYGTGVPITRKNALDQSAWTGHNNLGKMLMKIREQLRK